MSHEEKKGQTGAAYEAKTFIHPQVCAAVETPESEAKAGAAYGAARRKINSAAQDACTAETERLPRRFS